ncbi:DUF4123 domain-containing protein [Pseudomonas soli]|jgi:hypothetical protein|uniref:DUF4123 domain-containing protein n=1 Tax=Pseudomonas soli TaxID=1306993 RepID=A0A2V4I9K9_9PSED|nr:DUF4123 domain-containing protein [Pseudomonas soli]PYB79770.1 DUF4123 domain-containing protein [Pseudomonas soli]
MNGSFYDQLLMPLYQSDRYRLSAILELSRLDDEQLKKLAQRKEALHSLMPQQALGNLGQIGTVLCASNASSSLQGQSDFFWQFAGLFNDAVCGWVVSALPAERLAAHLAQASTLLAPDGHRYLLRFHTEQCLHVLHSRQDLPDIVEWLAPVHTWWAPCPDASRRLWYDFAGGDRLEVSALSGLRLDQRCWEALAEDPLAYRLADQLKHALRASGEPEQCHVVRLGIAQKLLAFAREAGFARQEDLITYVTFVALKGEHLMGDPAWQIAMNDALDKQRSLAESVQTHLHELLR